MRISDKGISFDRTEEVRGVIVTFEAVNTGKKSHNFSFLGKKTPLLKPGGKASFTVGLPRRGAFAYGSTVDKAKGFHGSFIVY